MPASRQLFVTAFETDLGWLALVGDGQQVCQVTFAQGTKNAALGAVDAPAEATVRQYDWNSSLVRRLQEFSDGAPDDFRDVELDLGHLTLFQLRIVKACRAIPYGQTASYGDVAAAAGNSRAARAVGNTMAVNRFALIVPCHRVVHRGGDVGRLNACGRARLQLRRLESQDLAFRTTVPPKRRRAARR